MKWLKILKRKIQFNRFSKGYWSGYSQGARRCLVANGMFLPLKITDINIYSNFVNHPPRSRKWTYQPWFEGFSYGYTEALSFYNSGDDPEYNNDSIHDQEIRIREEFMKCVENF